MHVFCVVLLKSALCLTFYVFGSCFRTLEVNFCFRFIFTKSQDCLVEIKNIFTAVFLSASVFMVCSKSTVKIQAELDVDRVPPL